MSPVKRMQIDWHSIFYEYPYGGVIVLSPKEFTVDEGITFLTLKRLTRYVNYCNRSMPKHWQMPPPLGVLPLNDKGCQAFDGHWGIYYKIKLDWPEELK